MVEPRSSMGRSRVQPVPADGDGASVAGRVRRRNRCGGGPRVTVGEPEFSTMLGRAALRAGFTRRRRKAQDPVGTDPADHLHRQIGEQERQPGQI